MVQNDLFREGGIRMNLKALCFCLTMSAFLVAPATLAATNTDTLTAIFCPGCNYEEEGGYSRVTNGSKKTGLVWSGGVVDCGWGENTVGFEINASNIGQVSFSSTSTGCAGPCVFYQYVYSGGCGTSCSGVSSSYNSETGVTFWTFNRLFACLPNGARVTALYFV
jgi:hypothetical protein